MMAETRRLFYQDEPLKAYQNLKKLEDSFVESSEVREFGMSEEMQMLKNDFRILTDFMEESRTGRVTWTRYYDLPDYKIYYRYEAGKPICSLFLERHI